MYFVGSGESLVIRIVYVCLSFFSPQCFAHFRKQMTKLMISLVLTGCVCCVLPAVSGSQDDPMCGSFTLYYIGVPLHSTLFSKMLNCLAWRPAATRTSKIKILPQLTDFISHKNIYLGCKFLFGRYVSCYMFYFFYWIININPFIFTCETIT